MGDRLKEALFAILEPALPGAAVLDLYAGSGAGALEALSRGAARAVLVERNAGALAAITRNVEATRLAGRATIRRAEVVPWLRGQAAADGPFDVVLVDPPYDAPTELTAALRAIAEAGPGRILSTTGTLVAKHPRREALPARIGLLASARERRFGESTLTFLRWAPDQESA